MWHILITMAVHHKHNLFYIYTNRKTCDTENIVADLNTIRCDSFVTYCDFSLQGYYLYQRCNVIFFCFLKESYNGLFYFILKHEILFVWNADE